jgi:hypothetical protein
MKRLATMILLLSLIMPVAVLADIHEFFTITIDTRSHYSIYTTRSEADGIYGDFEVTVPESGVERIITFFICDEENYELWENGQEATQYHLQENVGEYSFHFIIPADDTWYFVWVNYAFWTTKTVEFNYYRDTTAPEITVTSPTEDQLLEDTVELSATAEDEQFDVSKMEIYIDDILKTSSSEGSITYNWDTTTISDGEHEIEFFAADNVNNDGTVTRNVIVDNNAPSIDSPADMEFEEGEADSGITWNPSDVTPDRYVIYKDGSEDLSGSWSGGSISVSESSLNQLSEGTYYFKCEVWDELDRSAEDEVKVTVTSIVETTPTDTTDTTTGTTAPPETTTIQTSPPPTNGASNPMGLVPYAGAFGLLIIIAAGVALVRRGKKPEMPAEIATPPPEPEREPVRERELITERVMVICPFCGAKNIQGISKCQNCGGDL